MIRRVATAQEIPTLLATLRVEEDLSQHRLADRLDFAISQQQVSRWERGPRLPSVTSLVRLAHALGYDLALVPREDVPDRADCGCLVFRRQALIEKHTAECSEQRAAERFAASISWEMAREGE